MSDGLIAGLFILAVLILIVIIYVAYRVRRWKLDQNVVTGAFATSLKQLGLDRDIGEIKTHATDILTTSQQLQRMFEVKRGRAEFGEFQLEEILRDVLPKDKIGIRKNIHEVGIPDAYISSLEGTICIDSKFPLDNYRSFVESEEEEEKRRYQELFRGNVEGHVATIKEKYIKPDKGTAPFAFGFIPSEAVYQYLTEVEPSLVRSAAAEGVILVSPSTLVANLNLINLSFKATAISEKAEQIKMNLTRLERFIEILGRQWSTLKGHIEHASSKAGDVDRAYERLRMEHQKITEVEEEE